MTEDQESGQATDKPSRAQRGIHIVIAMLVVVVLPVVLLDVLIGHFAADAMFIGIALGVIGSRLGGTRRMLYIAPALGLAAGLGAFTAYDWWWVALLALLGVVAGGAMRWGWLPTLLMLCFAATFATQVSSGRNAIVFGVIAAIGAAYGVVLARRFGAPGKVEGQRVSVPQAIVVAAVFGIALGASASIGVALGWSEPYWVPEPILILTFSILVDKQERIGDKAVATSLGVIAAVPVAILALPTWAISIIASTAFVVALTQLKRYRLYYSLYTFGIVLALSSPGNVGVEAAQRGSEILAGIGLLVVGLAIIRLSGDWLAKRYPQPELGGSTTP